MRRALREEAEGDRAFPTLPPTVTSLLGYGAGCEEDSCGCGASVGQGIWITLRLISSGL